MTEQGLLSPSEAEGAHPVRFVSLEEARALECNGCGDCCDSRRTDGYWTWAGLPADGYAAQCEGTPLIVPLVNIGGVWSDRPHEAADLGDYTGTRFRCAAFVATAPTEALPEGGGACGRHDQWRPSACGEFPVGGAEIEADLARFGEVPLETGAFPRCTWFRMTIVRIGDPRLNDEAQP